MLRPMIAAHMRGALLLLRLKARGFSYIDSTMAGVRFSFIAAALAVPLYLLMLLDVPMPEGVSLLRYSTVHALSYILQWVLMPLLLYYACMAMNKRGAWPRLVAPYNWINVWQVLAYTILALLFDESGISDTVSMPIMLAFGFYIMGVQGWIYARVLQKGPLIAFLLVLLNIIVDWQLGIARFTLLSNPPA